jgi:predicted permease
MLRQGIMRGMGQMLRQFRRNRGFFAVVVALLGLGIGSATLVFGLVNELLLKPLPVRDPGNLYLVERKMPRSVRPDTGFSERSLYEVARKSLLVSAAIGELAIEPEYLVPLREGGSTRLLMAQLVSGNYFRELGVRAALGRVLDDADATATGTLPVVLSDHFWQSQYGGEASAIGRTMVLKSAPFRIVGVLPRGFHSSDLDRAPDIRAPMAAGPVLFGSTPQGVRLQLLLRLAPGVTAARAAAALEPELRRVETEAEIEKETKLPNPLPAKEIREDYDGSRFSLQSIERGVSRMRQQFGDALRLLLAGVGVLLLAVCANVAGLLIAKADDRRKEIGIRMAIGAGRGQVVRQLLAEHLALAIPGAVVGALFAWALAPRLVALLPPVRDLAAYATPQLLAVTPDWRVLAFAATVTIAATLVSGLAPAWRAAHLDLLTELKATRGQGRSKVSGVAPVAIQAAFCTVLLAGAGLMLRSWWKLDHLETGFDREHLIEFTVDPASGGYGMQQSGAVFTELRRRVRELPGVRAAAWSWRGVMRGTGIKTTFAPQGVVLSPKTFLNVSLNEVTPGYFDTMGVRLIAGRDLQQGDNATKPTRIVVNRVLAEHFFPGQDSIGKGLVSSTDGTKPPDRVIVGVVNNAKYRSMREPEPPTIYGLFDEQKGSDWQVILYVRTFGAPAAIANSVRETLRAIDASVPLTEVWTLDAEVRSSLWQERLVAILSGFFGVAAVLLAALGLYGALSLSVAQRRRELGIRVAIGARVRDVLRAVCSPMAVGVACGVGVGIAGAFGVLRVTRTLLYGVEPLDSVSIVGAVGVVVMCSMVAAAMPARRAARVDPAVALREE